MYTVPQFSREPVNSFLDITAHKTNPHLLLYRYLKSENSEQAALSLKKGFIPKADTSGARLIHDRFKAALDQWQSNQICRATMTLVDRMVVGKGISSSFESGLLLHWVHGIPMINGESLKGAARNFAREGLDPLNPQAVSEFKDVFGTVRKEETDTTKISRGQVIFFDAVPLPGQEMFDIDIITCHYGPYYMEETPQKPGDWHSPKPVPFPAVKAGTRFLFAVASYEPNLALKAWQWLHSALVQRGVGAKKRVGYGHFLPLANPAVSAEGAAVANDDYAILLKNIASLNLAKLPGGEGERIVKEIDKLKSTNDKKTAANGLLERISKKTQKGFVGKSWFNALKTLAGE